MKKLYKLTTLLFTLIISTNLMAQWNNLVNAGLSAGTVGYTNIAINSSGTPYVVYEDYGNSNEATVKNNNLQNIYEIKKATPFEVAFY